MATMSLKDRVFTLLAVDTAGIQSYIFGSNRLKENIGASYIVKQVTEDWTFEALNIAAPNNNYRGSRLDDDKKIEDGKIQAEVLYAGGGNFIVLFSDSKAAQMFTRVLSKKVLVDAPGLSLDIYQETFKWTGTGLGETVKRLLQNMK